MGHIEKIMLELIGKSVFGKEPDDDAVKALVVSENYSKLYSVSKKHDLAHLVGAALESLGLLFEDDISNKFRKNYYAAIYRYKGMEHELSAVKALFNSEGVAHIPLKGSVLRNYYPEPWMRTSCDIDILVHDEDIERASSLLTERLGYKLTSKCYHDVAFYSPGGVHLELHFTLIEESSLPKIEKQLCAVWERAKAIDGTYTYELSGDMFYFYHIAHMVKHFICGGCGVRAFMDLKVMENIADADSKECSDLLEEVGLSEFDARAKRLAAIWFDKEPSDEFFEEFGRFVISGGIYGQIKTKVLVSKKRRGGKLRYAISRIFLPYRKLKDIFPVLKKHKWLMPIFQVVRWFKLIFGGRLKYSMDELKQNASLSNEEAARAAHMVDELGLAEITE